MRRTLTFAAAGLLAAGIAFATTAAPSDKTVAPRALAADAPMAKAMIQGAGDNKDKISGTVTFTQEAHGVKVVADIKGLTPGKHGFHIHEKPDLSAPDLMSAGGHWNPTNHKHGAPGSGEHHAGDFGNLTADASGNAHLDQTFEGLSVNGSEAVVGHSVIIHEKADDLKSQPAGDSGKRIAGGVIKASGAGDEKHEH
jgi:Cu-Zn family superoxide dismutase